MGVCVSHMTAWKYLRQLTQEAKYLDVVRQGHWLWVYDNLNLLKSNHTSCVITHALYTFMYTRNYLNRPSVSNDEPYSKVSCQNQIPSRFSL